MGFSVIHDLSTLPEAERQQYLRDASQYFGLDPSLNALDLIWMDNGGLRRLVAYARRGTTDLLREIHQINVLSVTMATGPGFVSFTAIAKNLKGRQEIAVGAAGTDGLKGDKLAASVATAQTRALRRVTLQFIGGGLLDESEVGDNTMTDINRLPVSLSSIATAPVQPVVDPNTDAGKDVTLESRLAAGEKGIAKIPDAPDTRHAVLTQVNSVVSTQVDAVAEMPNPVPFSAGDITPAPVEEPKRKRRKKTDTVIDATEINHETGKVEHIVDPVSPNADIPESQRTPTNDQIAKVMLTVGTPAQKVEAAVYAGIPLGHLYREAGVEPTHHEPFLEKSVNQDAAEVLAQYPTDEQDKEFRARLSLFTDTQDGLLRKNGMTGPIIWRIRRYTKHLCPEVVIDTDKRMVLTIAQWEKLLNTLENENKAVGPKALVQIINEVAEKA